MAETKAARRKFHFLYVTTCLITGKQYYGMHSTDNINDSYLGSGRILRYSINKYGKENHRREIYGEMFLDRESLREAEARLIDGNKLKDPLCMNLCEGGGGDAKHYSLTKAHKEKISKALKGHKHSKISKLKMSLTKKTRISERGGFSEEHKQNLSKAHLGQVSPMKGKKFSDEHRKKLSEAQKRRFSMVDCANLGFKG